MRFVTLTVGLGLLAGMVSVSCGAPGKAYTDPKDAGPDFAIQGEYVGEFESAEKG